MKTSIHPQRAREIRRTAAELCARADDLSRALRDEAHADTMRQFDELMAAQR